jgi:hypothetical protein
MNGLEFARCTTAGGSAGSSIEFSNHTGRPDDWAPEAPEQER